MSNINVIGDVFCDILATNITRLPQWGEDVLSKVSIIPGGGALNCVSHGAKWIQSRNNSRAMTSDSYGATHQVTIALYSFIGNDSQGIICRDHLKSLGTDLVRDCCTSSDRVATGTCIVLSGEGDRCFVTDRGAIGVMDLAAFSIDSLLDGKHLHVAGYYNLTKICSNPQSLRDLLTEAKRLGLTTSLNPQHDATGQWGGIDALASVLDVIICNKEELLMMQSALAKNNQPSNSIEESAKYLLALGVKSLVVTCAEDGAYVFTLLSSSCECDDLNESLNESIALNDTGYPGQVTATIVTGSTEHMVTMYVPPVPLRERPLADATGAGDAFSGAFLVEFVSILCNNAEDNNNSGETETKISFMEAIVGGATAGCVAGAAAVTVVGGSNTQYKYF